MPLNFSPSGVDSKIEWKQDLGLQCQTPLRFYLKNVEFKKIWVRKSFGSKIFWVKNDISKFQEKNFFQCQKKFWQAQLQLQLQLQLSWVGLIFSWSDHPPRLLVETQHRKLYFVPSTVSNKLNILRPQFWWFHCWWLQFWLL